MTVGTFRPTSDPLNFRKIDGGAVGERQGGVEREGKQEEGMEEDRETGKGRKG